MSDRDEDDGPWYTAAEAISLGALISEYGQIVDANWRAHPKRELWKPLDLCAPMRPKFGTMA